MGSATDLGTGAAVLYVGVMGLNAAIEDRRAASARRRLLALIGVINVDRPLRGQGWNTCTRAPRSAWSPSSIDSSMLWPLLATVVGTKAWFVGSLLQRRAPINLGRNGARTGCGERSMQLDFLGLDFVGLAYAGRGVLAWDYVAPRVQLARVRRAIAARLRRQAARK